MMKKYCLTLVLALALSRVMLPFPAIAAPDEISVEFDAKTGTAEIFIPESDGEVSLQDIARGLAKARGFGDSALTDVLPDKSIPLDNIISNIAIVAINRSLDDAIRLRAESEGLRITLDEHAILASREKFRQLVLRGFSKVFSDEPDPEDFGLQLPENWREAPADKSLIILIHGLNSNASFMDGWEAALQKNGFLTADFVYPNDQPIANSAELLSEELKNFAENSKGRSVTLLTHSMGGLVSRAALEDPELDPGCVGQLIMLAPPSQGSQLANFSFGLEVWELLGLIGDEASWAKRVYRAVEDGWAEGANDLQPGSKFLTELNSRPRNPDVRYTIFAGSQSPMPENSNKLLIKAFAKAPDTSRLKRFFGPKLNPILEDMHEISNTTGDGLVSVERAKLDGVDDFVIMPFRHDTVLQPDLIKGLEEEVLKRLEK